MTDSAKKAGNVPTVAEPGKHATPMAGDGFFRAIVDALGSSLCVIDAYGDIQFFNRSWKEFFRSNGGIGSPEGQNYLGTCDVAAQQGCDDARRTSSGLRALIAGGIDEFNLEYPCNSPTEERWFILTARPIDYAGARLFVIKHKNITDRKLSERKIERLSLTDPLTGLPNLRRYEEFSSSQWRWHMREGRELSLIVLDLDHFKMLNDDFGHSYGDDCLRKVANVLADRCRRPHDLPARIGGEEFAAVIGDMSGDDAMRLAESIRKGIEALGIAHSRRAQHTVVTASIGVASMQPTSHIGFSMLYELADQALYRAKQQGRNQVARAQQDDHRAAPVIQRSA